MKMRLPILIIAIVVFAVAAIISSASQAYAFNLWEDVQQQTTWTLGSSVEAGTAVALRSDTSSGLKAGQFVGSALASVANYRMLNLAAGGTFVPQSDHTLRATETVKVGLNLAYVFKGFVNQPPAILKSLIIGPSLSMPIWTTPHVVIPFFDVNYAFGGSAAQ